MIDKEYEKETLDKLKKDLKDINTYTSFKNGTYFYDLGYFQGSVLVDELERYKNIVDELERYIKDELILDFYNDDMPCELIVNKMENMIKELKGE